MAWRVFARERLQHACLLDWHQLSFRGVEPSAQHKLRRRGEFLAGLA